MTEDKDALVEKIATAIFDPGRFVGFRGDKGMCEWQARAVLSILPPTTSAGDGELVPVAWRWRYVRDRGPDHWTVRQSRIEPHDAVPERLCALEVEPLYSAATVDHLLARVKELEEALTAAEAKTREEDAQWLQSDATALALCDAIQDIDMELWVGAIMPAGERWEVSKALLGHLTAIRSRMETDNGR